MRRIGLTTVLLTLALGVDARAAAQATPPDDGTGGGTFIEPGSEGSGPDGAAGTDGAATDPDAAGSSGTPSGSSGSGTGSSSGSGSGAGGGAGGGTVGGTGSGTGSSGAGSTSGTGSSGAGSTSRPAGTSGSPRGTGGASTSGTAGGGGGGGSDTAPAGSTVRTYEGRPVAAPVAAPEEEPEPEGDGRDVDFIYFELEGGVANVNLIAFSGAADFTMTGPGGSTFSEVESTGGYGALAVGFRVYWIAIGARAMVAAHSGFEIGSIGGEATLRFPIPVVEPYIRAGIGYAWQGNASYQLLETGSAVPVVHSTTVYGWAFNTAVGIDIYLANWITLGGGIGFDLLNLSRQTDPTGPCMGATDICPRQAGDAVGYNLRGYGQVTFRF